ncbi:MAG: hypothetical protein ICV53_14245, partial [Flavisolibacter sp.]|nr:hypothetical protein [Flavisolibacter sp.]
ALPCYLLPGSSLSGARTAFQQVQEADGVANNGFALAALQCLQLLHRFFDGLLVIQTPIIFLHTYSATNTLLPI